MVTTLLVLLLNSYVLLQDGRPLRAPPVIATPSGVHSFAWDHRAGLLRAEANDLTHFRNWLVTQRLTAVVTTHNQLATIVARGDARALARYGRVEKTYAHGVYRVQLGPGIVDPEKIAERMRNDPLVSSAEPDEWWEFQRREGDPLYPAQWHLHDTFDTGAAPASHLRAEEAWLMTRGNGVIISVADDGFSMKHPDLVPQYIEENGHYVAHDFVENDDDPSPREGDGHGTRVLGTAVAKGNNDIGGSGVCPDCRAIPMRLFTTNDANYDDTKLLGAASVVADAFHFAADHGARIINSSWGPTFSATAPAYRGPPGFVAQAFKDLVSRGGGKQGVLLVWAAGNQQRFMMSYDGWASDPRVFSIGVSTPLSELGQSCVMGPALALLAPSTDANSALPKIITTDLESGYSFTFNGTSASAPVAAGAAALVLSLFPDLTVAQLMEVLLDSAQRIDPAHAHYSRAGESCTHGAGRIDAKAALDLATARQASYASGFTLHFELCEDGLDNDNNAATSDTAGACARCIPMTTHEVLGNGIDDDCDGNIDNPVPCMPAGFPPCDPCTMSSQCQPDFACVDRGTDGKRCLRECSANNPCAPGESCQGGACLQLYAGQPVECSALSTCMMTNGGVESCDGYDNDCNGKVDDIDAAAEEAMLAQARCVDGAIGECLGRLAGCQGTAGWVCMPAKNYHPVDDSCDALDNNCNGSTDEDAPLCATTTVVPMPPKKKGCDAASPETFWPVLLALLFI